MSEQKALWSRLISGPRSEYMLRTAMWRGACGLSTMSERTISNSDPRVEKVPISQVATHAGDPEVERVGIYLVMSGGLHGQTLLILGVMERSALAEVGNLAVTSFLNTIAAHTPKLPRLLRPSPPAVMVDMLGVILDVIVTPVAAVRDDLLIIETDFKDTQGTIQGCFWVLPDPALMDLAA